MDVHIETLYGDICVTEAAVTDALRAGQLGNIPDHPWPKEHLAPKIARYMTAGPHALHVLRVIRDELRAGKPKRLSYAKWLETLLTFADVDAIED